MPADEGGAQPAKVSFAIAKKRLPSIAPSDVRLWTSPVLSSTQYHRMYGKDDPFFANFLAAPVAVVGKLSFLPIENERRISFSSNQALSVASDPIDSSLRQQTGQGLLPQKTIIGLPVSAMWFETAK
ncbi:MAG: hypothetical protein IKB76_01565 [Kiritimatiellae bacterium]|nr:hypothetical protein [Kiritimatiellia bacterium]